MAVEQWSLDVDNPQHWMTLAEERSRALCEAEARRADAERACQAWMKTAQLAEDWADHLGKVRLWLQDQLLAQSHEANDAHQEKDQMLGQLATLQMECEAAKKALVQKHEELYHLHTQLYLLEHSPGVRLWRWMREKLVPPQTLRGRLASKSVRVTLRLLRRSA